MRAALVAALCLLCSCATQRSVLKEPTPELKKSARDTSKYRCVTVCGLHGDFDGVACEALNTAEARILRFYTLEVEDFHPGYLNCMALDGWEVRTLGHDPRRDILCPALSWNDTRMGCVYGISWFASKRIEVLDEDFTFNALAHEIGHVLEHALSKPVGDTSSHCGWARKGIKRAILRATHDSDTTKETCD